MTDTIKVVVDQTNNILLLTKATDEIANSVSEATAAASQAINSATDSSNYAANSANYALLSANSALHAANSQVHAANAAVYAANSQVHAANAAINAANSAVYAANSQVYAANAAINAANSALYAANSQVHAANAAVHAANSALYAANSEFYAANSAFQAANSALHAATTALTTVAIKRVDTISELKSILPTSTYDSFIAGYYSRGDGYTNRFVGITSPTTFTGTISGSGTSRTLTTSNVTGKLRVGMSLSWTGSSGTIIITDFISGNTYTVSTVSNLVNPTAANMIARYVDNTGNVILPTGGDGNTAWLAIDSVSALTFGAVGDGVTDDTAALQRAVNSSKYVEIPVGKIFRVTNLITVPAGVYIYGNGKIFVDQSPYVRCFSLNSNCTVDGVTFIGTNVPTNMNVASSNFLGICIQGFSISNVTVKNCQFFNFRATHFNTSAGLIWFSSSNNIKVLYNYFDTSNYGQMDIRCDYRVGDTIIHGNISYSNSDFFYGFSTTYSDISSTIKFQNSANHIITNNIHIKGRWLVNLLDVSYASFSATIVPSGGTNEVATMTIVAGSVTGTITHNQILTGIGIADNTYIKSGSGNTWEIVSSTGVAIPTVSVARAFTSACGASFTGSISNKILTMSSVTGYANRAQWIFDNSGSNPLPDGTKIHSSTATFTGSISGTTLTITSMSSGSLVADGSETIYGTDVTFGTRILSQILPLTTGELIGGKGRYTISNSLTLGSRAMYINNRWNIIGVENTFSVSNISMFTKQPDVGRHGIAGHYASGSAFSNISDNFIGNVSRHGIYLRGNSVKAFDAVGPDIVRGNYLVYCGHGQYDVSAYSSGIRLESTLPTIASENYFYKTGFYPNNTPGIQEAQDIECDRGLSNSIISNNICIESKDGAIGLNTTVAASSIFNVKIMGNIIYNNKYGIALSTSLASSSIYDIQILNNSIYLTGAEYGTTGSYRSCGIFNEGTVSSFPYCLRVQGNIISGTGLAASFTGDISGKILTASSITGSIQPGHKLSWETASFQGSISDGSTGSGNILTVDSVTGSILANGSEILTGTSVTTGTVILSQLLPLGVDEVLGGKGRYKISNSLSLATRAMKSNLYDATVLSPQASFLASANSAGIMTVTEINNGTILANNTEIITGTGVTTGTRIVSQVTPLLATETSGGVGRYNITPAQTIASNKMSVTNIWNLADNYTATAKPMTSGSDAYGIAMTFGGDQFSATSLISDNIVRGLQYGIASLRFTSNIPNYMPHRKLGFDVKWERNRFVNCDTGAWIQKQVATYLAVIENNNIFEGCTTTGYSANISGNIGYTSAVFGRTIGQDSTGQKIVEFLASAAPSGSEQYYVGDRILNSNPTSGTNSGWICVANGAPATWQKFGQITLSGNTSYDPPSLGNSASTTTTVTVNGAVLGDYVSSVSFDRDLSTAQLSAWVSAANTVTVRFLNTSNSTSVDLASGTIRVNVTKP